MKLNLYQHAWTANGLDPDGATYATEAEADAAETAAGRALISEYAAADIVAALEESGVNLDQARLDEIAELDADAYDSLTAEEVSEAAQALRGYNSATYPITVEIAAEALLGQITESAETPSAKAYLETGIELVCALDAKWESGDLAGAVSALREWADDVHVDFPGLDLDYPDESEPILTHVLKIGPGDRVDLQGAPGCVGESFIGAEFEFAVCIGSERETADCIRLDFEGFPSVGFDPSVSLPVIKATPKEAALWVEG